MLHSRDTSWPVSESYKLHTFADGIGFAAVKVLYAYWAALRATAKASCCVQAVQGHGACMRLQHYDV